LSGRPKTALLSEGAAGGDCVACPPHRMSRCLELSSEWQIQRLRCVVKGLESEMQVERRSLNVLRIHDQCIRRDLSSRLQATVHRAAQEKLAQALTPLVCSTRKPAHAKARNGVAWQLLALGFAQTLAVDLGRAEGVVAQDAFGLRRIGEHVDRTDAAPAVLLGKAMQILIECRYAAGESLTIVDRRVKWMVVKHA
jgi:hypothetical protein